MASSRGIQLDPAMVVGDGGETQQRFVRLLAGAIPDATHEATAASFADAKARIAERPPRLALIETGRSDRNGVALIAWLHRHHPQIVTVAISGRNDEATLLATMQAGAGGYLLKQRDDAELVIALRGVRRGGIPIDPYAVRHLLPTLQVLPAARTAAEESCGGLTKRKAEVLKLIASGRSNREIAQLTALSLFTVESYTKAIYRKLAVNSRTAAVFEAKARGWLR